MNSNRKFILALISIIAFSGAINAQDAQQPTIMIFPSDNLLKSMGCLYEKEIQGATVYVRDYQKAFTSDFNLKFVISAIQERFADRGYPLQDMEYALKQLQSQRTLDVADGFDVDPKTALLKSARPDIFLDIGYEFKDLGMTNRLAFNISAVDAYTWKAIGAASNPGIQTSESDIVKLISEQVEKNIQNLQSSMQVHFDDLKVNGREIVLRVTTINNAVSDFRRDKCGSSLPLAMWLQQWVKSNTVNGMHRRDLVAAKEIKFNQVRIPLYDDQGYPQAASDFAFKLATEFYEGCSLIAVDYTTSLGEALVVISN